ncbi:MAG: hypothetical protein GX591_18695 [Planctomycetes bacterium]|nr:hypothetical protein [Planctomycetota bacterium]
MTARVRRIHGAKNIAPHSSPNTPLAPMIRKLHPAMYACAPHPVNVLALMFEMNRLSPISHQVLLHPIRT